MFNSIPALGGGAGGPAVDETARAAAAAAQASADAAQDATDALSAGGSFPLPGWGDVLPYGFAVDPTMSTDGVPIVYLREDFQYLARPIYIPGITISRIGAHIYSGTDSIRIGLYTVWQGRPHQLVADTGELSFSGTIGPVEASIAPVALDGWYFLVLVSGNANGEILCGNGSIPIPVIGTADNNDPPAVELSGGNAHGGLQGLLYAAQDFGAGLELVALYDPIDPADPLPATIKWADRPSDWSNWNDITNRVEAAAYCPVEVAEWRNSCSGFVPAIYVGE